MSKWWRIGIDAAIKERDRLDKLYLNNQVDTSYTFEDESVDYQEDEPKELDFERKE